MDENDLIQAARQGELESFNQLVVKYQDLVFHQAFCLLDNHEAAEDLTQDAFMLAYKGLPSFRGGSFRAWLLRIVTNACYDELRRRKQHNLVPLNPLDADDEEIESVGWLVDQGPSVEESVERAELLQALQGCVDELPNDFRLVVMMIDVHGLDYTEAATALTIPIGTVKSRLARARLRLRDILKARITPGDESNIAY